MDARSGAIEFEIHQLLLMRCSDSEKRDKLADFGISIQEATIISDRVHRKLHLGPEQFSNLKELIDAPSATTTSIRSRSSFWPQFDFIAESTNFGTIGPARYVRSGNMPTTVANPADFPLWSVTVDEFSQLFGPLQAVDSWYPNEEYVFDFDGQRYGVGFGWGLFLGIDRL